MSKTAHHHKHKAERRHHAPAEPDMERLFCATVRTRGWQSFLSALAVIVLAETPYNDNDLAAEVERLESGLRAWLALSEVAER
jgi:hypothetical protein